MFGGKKATIKHDGYSDGMLYRTCPHCGEGVRAFIEIEV